MPFLSPPFIFFCPSLLIPLPWFLGCVLRAFLAHVRRISFRDITDILCHPTCRLVHSKAPLRVLSTYGCTGGITPKLNTTHTRAQKSPRDVITLNYGPMYPQSFSWYPVGFPCVILPHVRFAKIRQFVFRRSPLTCLRVAPDADARKLS